MNDKNRIKKDLHNNAEWLWLRSAYDRSNSYVAYVYYNGYVDYVGYSYEGGVVPAFII